MNRVHHALVLLAKQGDTGFELQLRLGQVEAFAVHRDIVAVGARDQPVHGLDVTGVGGCP